VGSHRLPQLNRLAATIDGHGEHHRRAARSTWRRRLLVAGGLGVGALAVALVLLALLGRPHVEVTSSTTALADVQMSGAGTRLSSVEVDVDGRPVPVARRGSRLWPNERISEGAEVVVRATAAAPSWLSWLEGGPVSTTVRLRAPTPRPVTTAAVLNRHRRLAVRFSSPVASVRYAVPDQPAQTMQLAAPEGVVDLPIRSAGEAGTIVVSAVGRRWERPPGAPGVVSWFVAPAGGGPAVLADPAPSGTAETGTTPITLTFSEPVRRVLGDQHPRIDPSVPGQWSEPDSTTLVFTPSGFGFGPSAQVTVTLDRALSILGVGDKPMTSSSFSFTTAPGSLLRVDQILARLGYLPVTFTPSGPQPTTTAAEEAAVYQPPAGSFAWRWAGTPPTLAAQWVPGQPTALLKGALMTFEAAQNTYDDRVEYQTVDQMLTATVWNQLIRADLADQHDPYPFAYIYVTEQEPETLTLWLNGQVALSALANTGIAQDPTTLGTFPIYLRYTHQVMRGVNPDGTPYADYVQWVNYFDGSEAVHGFVRASYGFPQSLGCVELPPATAGQIFPDLMVGDLVTVVG
jgi:lipoprotein-anchoring transpeptidase ErfK/SrfK